jgi:hypothetical protein
MKQVVIFAMEPEPLPNRAGALILLYSILLSTEKRELEFPLYIQGLGTYSMNKKEIRGKYS